jgi:Lon protease-like protein
MVEALERTVDPSQLQAACDALPVFPLPRTVLMPGAVLPLHVFEERYRALVEHVLESGGLMGIATLRPGYEDDYDGAPALYPEVGIGQIVGHQRLPDGRSNIVLQYVGRATLTEELPSGQPYRVVRAQVQPEADGGVGGPLQRLKVLVLQLGAVSPDAAEEAGRLVGLDGMEMVDGLARKLFADPDEQRRYLAAAQLAERVHLVEDRLATFLMTAQQPAADA